MYKKSDTGFSFYKNVDEVSCLWVYHNKNVIASPQIGIYPIFLMHLKNSTHQDSTEGEFMNAYAQALEIIIKTVIQ